MELANNELPKRVDLACGQSKKAGFIGIDRAEAPGVDIVHDLTVYPWPFADNSVDELHSSHYVEHIPMVELFHGGKSKDAFFAFFDECYRILKPGGTMLVICPHLQNVRAFQDPTHRRFIPAESFVYLNKEWRDVNRLNHYNVDCNFAGKSDVTTFPEMNTLHPEAAARRFKESWNVIQDLVVTLIAIK